MSRPVVWITGASSGIGLAAAARLAKGGWHVAITGRNAEALERARAEIGGDTLAVAADVTDAAATRAAAAEIAAKAGPIAALIANAGTNVSPRAWGEVSAQGFSDVIDANLKGAYHSIDAVLPQMRAGGGGRVVAVASFAGWHVTPQPGPAYTASKMAVLGLCQSLTMAEMANGIVATALCPGEVATPVMQKRVPPPSPETLARMLQPDDIAAAIAYILDQPPRVAINELVLTPAWNNAYNRVPGPPPKDR